MDLCESYQKCALFVFVLFVIDQHEVSSRFQVATPNREKYLIVAGGKNRDGGLVPKVQAYRIENDEWLINQQLDRTNVAVFNMFWPHADEGSYILKTGDSLMKIGGRTEYFRIDKWRSNKDRVLHPLPYSRQGFREGACATAHNGNAYLIGGGNAGKTISRLDVASSRWTDLTNDVPLARSYCGAATFEDNIYVCGNDYPDGDFAKMDDAVKCFIYKVATNQIAPMASMEHPRTGNFLVQHGDHLYAVGGNYHQSAERYNLRSHSKNPNGNEKWDMLPSSQSAGRKYAMAVSDGYNRIYLLGGVRHESARPGARAARTNNLVEYYDIRNNRWHKARSPMPVGVTAAGVVHVAFPED